MLFISIEFFFGEMFPIVICTDKLGRKEKKKRNGCLLKDDVLQML